MWNLARIKAESGLMRCERECGQVIEETGDALAMFACTRTSAAFLCPGFRDPGKQSSLQSQ